MNCDQTEKVSLLVDAELAPAESAQLRAHIETCAACREAQEGFLLLRRQLRAYEFAPDPRAQQAALASIIASRRRDDAPARPQTKAPARGLYGWIHESFAGVFRAPHLKPARSVALLLLVAGSFAGALWFAGSDVSVKAPPVASQTDATRAPAVRDVAKVDVEQDANRETERTNGEAEITTKATAGDEVSGDETKTATFVAANRTAAKLRATRERVRSHVGPVARSRRNPSGVRIKSYEQLEREQVTYEHLASAARPAAVPYVADERFFNPEFAESISRADSGSRVARHAEQAGVLLRSFRNARFAESDPTFDVAAARARSKRLLYHNIVLRREALSAGNVPVEDLLDSLEPILLDISNMPARPSHADVKGIKERIERKQLVGVLQVQAALTPSLE